VEREVEVDGPLARQLDRTVCRRKPGDPAADDGELQRCHVSLRRAGLIVRRREPVRPAS
jgi:hypothetical protein